MEPISTGVMAAIGLGFQAFGMFSSQSSAKEYNEAQTKEIALEQQRNALQYKAMVLKARRDNIQILRQTQQARAAGLVAATSQGAQFSSSAAAGQGQASAQGAWNSLGIAQNLEIGKDIFSVDSQISQSKIQMANAQMGMQEGQAFSSFGSSLMGSATPFGRLFSGFGNKNG